MLYILTSDYYHLVQADLTTEEIDRYAYEAEQYITSKIQRRRRLPVGWAQDADGNPVPEEMEAGTLYMLRTTIARLVEHYAEWDENDTSQMSQGSQSVSLRGRGPRNPTRILDPVNRWLTQHDTHSNRGIRHEL